MNILDFFLYLIRRGTAEPEPFPKSRLAQYFRAITSEVALDSNGCCGREYGGGVEQTMAGRRGSSDGPSLQSLRPSQQQLLKQLSHAFFKLIDTPEQTSLQLA
jgi:hypothetical protein